jgi:hypothetical protein
MITLFKNSWLLYSLKMRTTFLRWSSLTALISKCINDYACLDCLTFTHQYSKFLLKTAPFSQLCTYFICGHLYIICCFVKSMFPPVVRELLGSVMPNSSGIKLQLWFQCLGNSWFISSQAFTCNPIWIPINKLTAVSPCALNVWWWVCRLILNHASIDPGHPIDTKIYLFMCKNKVKVGPSSSYVPTALCNSEPVLHSVTLKYAELVANSYPCV